MDPNEALKRLRELLRDDQTDPDGGLARGAEAIEVFEALDGWLSNGGFLPDAWKGKR